MSRECFITRRINNIILQRRNYRANQNSSVDRHRVLEFVKIRSQRLRQRALHVPAEFHVSQQVQLEVQIEIVRVIVVDISQNLEDASLTQTIGTIFYTFRLPILARRC